MGERGAREPEEGIEVGLEDPVETIVGELLELVVASHLVARVVDQDVQPAEGLNRLCNDPVAVGPSRQVGGQGHAAPLLSLEQAHGLLGVFRLLGKVGERDCRTFARERDDHGPPDARVAAGY